MIISLFILALIGLIVSGYAYSIEKKLLENPTYTPACDINDRISCSRPLQSKYAKMFFISNSLAGIIFYAGIAVLAFADAPQLIFLASVAACILSLILAYLLYVKIKAFCIVCTALYLVNFALLWLSWAY